MKRHHIISVALATLLYVLGSGCSLAPLASLATALSPSPTPTQTAPLDPSPTPSAVPSEKEKITVDYLDVGQGDSQARSPNKTFEALRAGQKPFQPDIMPVVSAAG